MEQSTGAPAMRPAGLGARGAAALIDLLLAGVVLGIVATSIAGKKLTVAEDGTTTEVWSATGSSLLLWVGLALAYGVIFEGAFGATIGKFMLGLRVRRTNGARIPWDSALTRNVLRLVDAIPYVVPYVLGAVVAANTNGQRIGDRAAGTLVVYRRSAPGARR